MCSYLHIEPPSQNCDATEKPIWLWFQVFHLEKHQSAGKHVRLISSLKSLPCILRRTVAVALRSPASGNVNDSRSHELVWRNNRTRVVLLTHPHAQIYVYTHWAYSAYMRFSTGVTTIRKLSEVVRQAVICLIDVFPRHKVGRSRELDVALCVV